MSFTYLIVALLALCAFCLADSVSGRDAAAALNTWARAPAPYLEASSTSDPFENVDLLDIVLVASVDGKFHALNRTYGQVLWSMSAFTSDQTSVPSTLAPLVRTQHPNVDPDTFDDTDTHETYIIEPQTGDIYIATSQTSLQRFPWSMSQLVDSGGQAFKYGEGKDRMFVGRKETSLLLVELETGKIKATLDPQCPWDQFQDLHDDGDIDLDELEADSADSIPERTTEVFIGRTDYRITIFDRSGGALKVMQNLSFSSYGPNNQDWEMQAAYRHTKDSQYIQTTSKGTVYSVKTHSSDSAPDPLKRIPFLWQREFRDPIVAVFDVFGKAGPPNESKTTFVLLQPAPQLKDVFDLSSQQPPNTQDAFVGMVKETGSLYALSTTNYPFVSFPEDHTPRDREEAEALRLLCLKPDGILRDRRCHIGTRKVDNALIQSSIQAPLPPPSYTAPPLLDGPRRENVSSIPSSSGHLTLPPTNEGYGYGWRTAFLPVLLAVASAGFFLRPSRRNIVHSPQANSPHLSDDRTNTPLQILLPPVPTLVQENGTLMDLPTTPATPHSFEDDPQTTPRKKVRRGKRGGGGKKKAASALLDDPLDEGGVIGDEQAPTPRSNISFDSPPLPVSKSPSLAVSDTILGFGSHGTVVFKGSLQGRAVAVKRLLQDFVTLASREVSILQESDYHPNVIRYYYQEAQANFLYIALELCPCSLADVIENPDRDEWRDIAISFEPKKALQQITSGLRHLHGLKLVHRDIKPQNILISSIKSIRDKPTYRMLISDFGLCKKLDLDQTSFLPTAHGAMAAGTVGWRAPEILRGEVKLDDVSDENSVSSRGSVNSTSGGSAGSAPGKPTRLTKSIDIFALGCLFYYTMTNGSHPFGDRFEREINILKNAKTMDGLERFGEEGSEASDLIESMLAPDSRGRPDTATCLLHPFFWDSGRRLNFLQDASDRFEIMCRDPKDPNLITLESGAFDVVGGDWRSRLDKTFLENLGKFRKYDGASLQDLLRALRNKKNHYQDLPEHVKRTLGPLPDGFLAYFTRRYPDLFLHVHSVIRDTSLRTDPLFRSYFDLVE